MKHEINELPPFWTSVLNSIKIGRPNNNTKWIKPNNNIS